MYLFLLDNFLKGSYDTFSFVFGVLQAVRAYRYKIHKVTKIKVSNPEIFFLKVKTYPHLPKCLIQTTSYGNIIYQRHMTPFILFDH